MHRALPCVFIQYEDYDSNNRDDFETVDIHMFALYDVCRRH